MKNVTGYLVLIGEWENGTTVPLCHCETFEEACGEADMYVLGDVNEDVAVYVVPTVYTACPAAKQD